MVIKDKGQSEVEVGRKVLPEAWIYNFMACFPASLDLATEFVFLSFSGCFPQIEMGINQVFGSEMYASSENSTDL